MELESLMELDRSIISFRSSRELEDEYQKGPSKQTVNQAIVVAIKSHKTINA